MRSEAAINIAQRFYHLVFKEGYRPHYCHDEKAVVNTTSNLTSVVGGYWCNVHTVQQTGVS